MATYTFYMGPHVTGYLTDTGDSYYTCEITGYGDMYESIEDFTVPQGQQVNIWNMRKVHQNSLIIPIGITSIAKQCFENIGELYAVRNLEPGVRNVILPESIIKIGDQAFASTYYLNIPKIQNFSFGHNIKEIGKDAFSMQTSVRELDFHDNSGIKVGQSAFYRCSNVEYIGLPDDYEKIGGVIGQGGRFEGCYNLSRLSPKNVVYDLNNDDYKYCNKLGSICIMDREMQYSPWIGALYVELFAGDNCDEEGYYITEVDPDSVIAPDVVIYDWKENWHRIIVYKLSIYLYHMGRIVTIKCYDSGDIPLKHEDAWYFLKWVRLNGKNFNPGQSPLFVTHRGHWYQISY